MLENPLLLLPWDPGTLIAFIASAVLYYLTFARLWTSEHWFYPLAAVLYVVAFTFLLSYDTATANYSVLPPAIGLVGILAMVCCYCLSFVALVRLSRKTRRFSIGMAAWCLSMLVSACIIVELTAYADTNNTTVAELNFRYNLFSYGLWMLMLAFAAFVMFTAADIHVSRARRPKVRIVGKDEQAT